MATLVELTDDCLRLMRAVDELGDFDLEPEDLASAEESLRAALDELLLDVITKADRYGGLIAELEAEEAKWKREEERVTARRRAAANAQRELRARLCLAMGDLGCDEIVGARYRIKRQRNGAPSTRLLVSEDEAVRLGYGTMVPKVESKRIVDAWRADPESVAEVAEVTVGYHVRVR